MRKKLSVLVAMLLATGTLSASEVAPFQKGERVLFLGASNTEIGLYISYLQLFQALRHSDRPVHMINAGIGGESAKNAINRLETDVFPQKPDRVFILFGMNDVGRELYKEADPGEETLKKREVALNDFRAFMEQLTDKLSAAGIRVDILSPTPYDEYRPGENRLPGVNESGLAGCDKIARELAKKKNLGLVELHAPMTEMMKRYPEARLCGDRIHPWDMGQLIMACLILNAMGETPEVAAVTVDAVKCTAEARNASVTSLRNQDKSLRFTYAPKNLPYPVTGYYRRVDEKFYPVSNLLNQEVLKITGLAKGNYKLSAAGEPLKVCSAEELAGGINLALLGTPSQKQAKKLELARGQWHEAMRILRNITVLELNFKRAGYDWADSRTALEAAEKWLEKRSSTPWYNTNKKQVEQYRREKPREEEYRRQFTSAEEQMYQSAPMPVYEITIEPIE